MTEEILDHYVTDTDVERPAVCTEEAPSGEIQVHDTY
jgi:hypothetical protein